MKKMSPAALIIKGNQWMPLIFMLKTRRGNEFPHKNHLIRH